MSKILNHLIDNDNRFDNKLRFDKDSYGYHVYLNTNYQINNCHTIYGKNIKDIIKQLKDIESINN